MERFQVPCSTNPSRQPQHLATASHSLYRDKFSNLVHLIEFFCCFQSASNATVERGFSTMKRIKTDWRSRLGEETLDQLLCISTDGPPPSKFDPNPAVEQFISTPRRPDTVPYGSRKLSHSENETELDTDCLSCCVTMYLLMVVLLS